MTVTIRRQTSALTILIPGAAPADAAQQRPGGSLLQLRGTEGCLTDRSTPKPACTKARALTVVTRFLPNGGPTVTDSHRLKPS